MHLQDFKSGYGIQYAYGRIWEKRLSNMKEEYNLMSAEKILHEATKVFQAARQHASELSERGVTDEEFHAMRVLITHVAARTYTSSLGNNINYASEVRDLKIYKEVIVRMAEMRFGHTSNVLNEFKYAGPHSLYI
ncbi:MAG: hypothetical protein ABSC53_03150 [Bacteroidota bacterium]